jgi:NAD(P)-dependent dehydrogenase (short-subunit alcohol dehydrogenase family)
MVSEKFYTVVVGIGPGTGRAVAIRFSKEYPVVLLARKPESYENAVAHITKAGGRAIGIAADATDKDSLKKAFETIEKELPGFKLAAAVYNVRPDIRKIGGFGPFLERTLEQLDTTLKGEVCVRADSCVM